MQYIVELTPAARRQIGKLDRPLQRRLYERLKALEEEPRPPGMVQLKATADLLLYRIRVGDYRAVYTIRDDRLLVLVVRIGHRREVYR